MAILVLGAGIVGSASAWDLRRLGHDVTIADIDEETVAATANAYGAAAATIDAGNGQELVELVGRHEIVVSAIPYRYGYAVASAALTTGTQESLGGVHVLDGRRPARHEGDRHGSRDFGSGR